jgi:arylsulfatase A-like enzyme
MAKYQPTAVCYKLFFAPLLLCVFALSFFMFSSHPSRAQTTHLTHVIVISLDGARPDAILQAQTPNIQALAQRGAVDWTAQTVFPPVTLPAHVSMLTGLDVSAHGVNWNDNDPSHGVLPSPTFVTLAQQAGYRTAMVVGKEIFWQVNQMADTDYTFARRGDGSVVDRVIELLQADYQVIFAHFPNPDYFGHSTGWMSDVYQYELSNTDWNVGRILTALDELGLTNETLVILTADHGGHGTVHGSDIPEDMNIPWIAAGPGIVPSTILHDARVTDTAATVLAALGLPQPEGMAGRPIVEAFDRFGV